MIKDRTASSKILDIAVNIVMIVILIATLYPVLYVLSSSLSSSAANDQGLVSIFPIGFNLDAYISIWEAQLVPHAFLNSVLYTTLGTAINLILTGTYAYALSRKRLALRKFYTTVALIPMYFSGGLIPSFLLVAINLNLYNSIWSLILPGAISVSNLIIMRSFFMSIPVELEESAYLDGANDMVIFYKIVLPLSKAAIYTIGLYYAVGHWNSWFNAMIYLKDSGKFPLQMVLRQVVLQTEMLEEAARSGDMSLGLGYVNLVAVKYATLVVSMVPMLIIYPFVQKHFVKGVMIGSLKG